MAEKQNIPRIKLSKPLFMPVFTIVLLLLLISLLSACAGPAATNSTTSSAAAKNNTTTPTISITTTSGPARPQGELVAGRSDFGNENFLPWKADASSSQTCCLVYDLLIYWDELNLKFIPGLAESWQVSPDGRTLTYNLRKGIEFSDGWGELTAEDVKYTFEQHTKSSVGLGVMKSIKSMDIPDPFTLIVNFKVPQPTFYMAVSAGNAGAMQGIACKKYLEAVGEVVAAQKPIGSGPYKMIDAQPASYQKFEALDGHWRVVPEFKYLTIRVAPEVSTIIAMLKNKEIDLAQVPAEQMAGLKAAGVATEVSPAGGGILGLVWGGIVIPEDERYDASYHNKDPWTEVRVRKALSLAIDRQAICNTIFSGGAFPAGVPLFSPNMEKYQYPYDPEAAKQLLTEAGYPDGFSFKAVSFTLRTTPETPRLVEAMVGYWQQIGLDPQIVMYDYAAYSATHRNTLKNAGEISVQIVTMRADMVEQAFQHFMPGAMVIQYQDEQAYTIYKEANTKMDPVERQVYVDKLNQYYFEKYDGALVRTSYCYARNSAKVSQFPHSGAASPEYLEYIRHSQPLNTFRLFTPWPGR